MKHCEFFLTQTISLTGLFQSTGKQGNFLNLVLPPSPFSSCSFLSYLHQKGILLEDKKLILNRNVYSETLLRLTSLKCLFSKALRS